ncbi:MAG TPA: XdhC family protein [Candidatus Ignatzschineria merdigallinarum]|uniref:XdhC family protein n=1 Tax=Candidatus Ignatzschineria merdigallinarum TaxID=2838621 RepID=A0A9D1TUA6_9GAMM|nr:XdhC family protein [Candidatus Ignatzschineria merdigallinarum]
MKTLDLLVIETALKWSLAGETIWLCTVIHTYGSAPRSPGALFAATKSGQYVGSLSGGCIEDDFLAKLKSGFFTNRSELVVYGEMSETFRPTTTLPCGGTIDVLVEHLPASNEAMAYLTAMLQSIKGHQSIVKSINIGESATYQPADHSAKANISHCGNTINITLTSCTTLFIAGISAVGLYCIDFALSLGFSVIVAEDRPEELRQIRANPRFSQITLIESFPAQYLEINGVSKETAIISLTHDPRIDDFTMIAALETPAFYIGAMGSKRNSENRLARLRECTDYSDTILKRIHAPIGLAIGSKTPAEIALAIMADIIQVKNTQK